MNPRQLAYFRRKLDAWRTALMEQARHAIEALRQQARDVTDDAELAALEAHRAVESHTRDRCRKLNLKIEQALRKIELGRYGYCDETGEPIGLARLEARPIAAYSLDVQERRELLRRRRLH